MSYPNLETVPVKTVGRNWKVIGVTDWILQNVSVIIAERKQFLRKSWIKRKGFSFELQTIWATKKTKIRKGDIHEKTGRTKWKKGFALYPLNCYRMFKVIWKENACEIRNAAVT